MEIFNILIFAPIYNTLIFLYTILWNDIGIAIVVLTILIKIAMFGMSKKQISSQKEIQEIQPLIKEIQKKYKGDKEKLAKKTMALYKEHKINPAAGCLPLIVQLIVFISLYQVIIKLAKRDHFVTDIGELYEFVPSVETINNVFLGFMDLSTPYIPLAIITAIAQYYQIKMMQAKTTKDKKEDTTPKKKETPDFATILQKQMLIVIPIMTLFIGFTFPSGLTLYWFTSTTFMILQQYYIMHKKESV